MSENEDKDNDTLRLKGSLWQKLPLALGEMTMDQFSAAIAGPSPTVILPIGSVEPHGPHLPLSTDAILAEECARRAVQTLRLVDVSAVAAPALHYGVTLYASGFPGAISISPSVVEQLVREVCVSYRRQGFMTVCVTNHHLEPDHVSSIHRGVVTANDVIGGVVFANHLNRRWGAILSEEFRRGECHAGSYETSLVMNARPDLVSESERVSLSRVPISLSDEIRAGRKTFLQMGIERAYAGDPAAASLEEGDGLFRKLIAMIVTEVRESIASRIKR